MLGNNPSLKHPLPNVPHFRHLPVNYLHATNILFSTLNTSSFATSVKQCCHFCLKSKLFLFVLNVNSINQMLFEIKYRYID